MTVILSQPQTQLISLITYKKSYENNYWKIQQKTLTSNKQVNIIRNTSELLTETIRRKHGLVMAPNIELTFPEE